MHGSVYSIVRRPRPQVEETIKPINDASHLYEVERRARYAERPGFRISELQISPTQKGPWHCHSNIQDVLRHRGTGQAVLARTEGGEVRLGPGDIYSVQPRRPHLVANGGNDSATFLALQGVGEYDYVPLVEQGGAGATNAS